MINIMRWLYELFNVDQIRIIFVSMFSSLLAYLTPTKDEPALFLNVLNHYCGNGGCR